MQSFTHTIRDSLGIHARPAGVLVKAAAKYKTTQISLAKNGTEADMKKLFRVMGLAVKCGETVTVSAEGEEEQAALAEIRAIFEEQL